MAKFKLGLHHHHNRQTDDSSSPDDVATASRHQQQQQHRRIRSAPDHSYSPTTANNNIHMHQHHQQHQQPPPSPGGSSASSGSGSSGGRRMRRMKMPKMPKMSQLPLAGACMTILSLATEQQQPQRHRRAVSEPVASGANRRKGRNAGSLGSVDEDRAHDGDDDESSSMHHGNNDSGNSSLGGSGGGGQPHVVPPAYHHSSSSTTSERSASQRRISCRRGNVDGKQMQLGMDPESAAFLDFALKERGRDWLRSFRRTDPRPQILRFFNDVAQGGADEVEERGIHRSELISPLLRVFQRAGVFTVWRPTSRESIQKMMQGRGTGKGLDVKGKSAKRGKLSAYVPFLQIHEENHKRAVRTLPRDGRIRVFYGSPKARDEACDRLNLVVDEMKLVVAQAKAAIADMTGSFDEEDLEDAMQKMTWDMDDPTVLKLDQYKRARCFGIDMPQRLFWEAYVMRNDISREPGSEHDTGRPSQPSFQDMNFAAMKERKVEDPSSPADGDGKAINKTESHEDCTQARAVVWQFTDPYSGPNEPDPDPMLPQTLLMAYEENGRVLPVVSDFDCFLVGTRGVSYDSPLPPEQVDMVKWCVSQIEHILDGPPDSKSWTAHWLEVLKRKAEHSGGRSVVMPRFGFGDPKSYSIMGHAVSRLQESGAVRHGAECFNYYFPQELDEEWLVISDTFEPVPWRYVDQNELLDILRQKIDEGFTFPLNPKWVLCDPGWKDVYDRLLASDKGNVQRSLDAWFPPESGVRERIEAVHAKHPDGFLMVGGEEEGGVGVKKKKRGTQAMDLAELELERYLALQRAKRKVRAMLFWISLAKKSREKLKTIEVANSKDEHDGDALKGDSNTALEALDDGASIFRGKRVSFDDDASDDEGCSAVPTARTNSSEVASKSICAGVIPDGAHGSVLDGKPPIGEKSVPREGASDNGISAVDEKLPGGSAVASAGGEAFKGDRSCPGGEAPNGGNSDVGEPARDGDVSCGSKSEGGGSSSVENATEGREVSRRSTASAGVASSTNEMTPSRRATGRASRRGSITISQWERGIDVIDSLLDLGCSAPPDASQIAGLEELREMLSAKLRAEQCQVPKVLLDQAKCGNRMSLYIAAEFGGVVVEERARPTLRSVAMKVKNTQKFLKVSKLAVLKRQKMEHFVPAEWTRLDPAARSAVSEMLSMDNLARWDFNVLELARLCNGSPLLFVGWAILGSPHSQRAMAVDGGVGGDGLAAVESSDSWPDDDNANGYDFLSQFDVKPITLCAFLRAMEAEYHAENPYHNNVHAADVVQTVHALLKLGGEKFVSDSLQQYSLFLAAVMHDVDHPGRNNSYQINARTDLALQYNDSAVLEQMHVSKGFRHLLGAHRDPEMDILQGLDEDQLSAARSDIIKIVLETDMTRHFTSCNRMKSLVKSLGTSDPTVWANEDGGEPVKELLGFFMHQADISNQAKPPPLFTEWTDRVLTEFFEQGDDEKVANLPVSPLCDRHTTERAGSQIGFISFVVRPAFEILGELIPRVAEEVLPLIDSNLAYWEKIKMDSDQG